jgi:DNA helicase TIP49 (TBP-interacting protein)
MPSSVAVCRKCKDHECLEDFLRKKTGARVDEVRCQKICEGPVAGVEIDGRMEWFERVSTPKAMVGLRRVVNGKTKLTRSLQKRRVKKHSGRAPR